MIEKIKKHFRNLNNTQKVFYLTIVTIFLLGDFILQELDVWRGDRGFVIFGIILISVTGIFLFKNKSYRPWT